VGQTIGKSYYSTHHHSIVKIWDKHSMSLQASLHSHQDVITDIDISKCNRYLATASIDGKIIIWDWKNCKKIDEINDHHANVNNIKFFTLTTKSQPDKSEDSVESSLEEI
jgi:WD40 repeat protein